MQPSDPEDNLWEEAEIDQPSDVPEIDLEFGGDPDEWRDMNE